MIKPALHQTITDTINHMFVEREKYSFRGSSLPYCPVRDCLVRCQTKTNTVPMRQTKFEWRLAADIGTTIHALLQKAMGERGTIFGQWKCPHCSTTYGFSVGPVRCNQQECSRPNCEYVELEVRDPDSGFSGHVDCLIPYEGGYILCDFKTIYRKKLSKLQLDHRHRCQVFAYKYLLQRSPYNLDIRGQAIVYFPREDVSMFEIIEMENDDLSEAEFVRYTKHKAAADSVMESGNLASLSGLCTTSTDQPFCPYNALCFGPDRTENLNGVWRRTVQG